MKKLLFALLLVGCGQSIVGSGQLKTTTMPPSGAKTVKFFGFGQLQINQGNADTLSITTDDNLLPYLDTRLQGDVLTLDQKSGAHLKPSKDIDYKLTLKGLDRLDWSGAGKVSLSDIHGPRLVLLAAGAGQLQLAGLQIEQLTLDLGGAVNVVAAGQVKNLNVQGSGAGNLDAKALQAEAVTLKMSGTGNAAVNATATLDANLSGVGGVTYFGNPKVNQVVTGIGKISPG
ncbi:MAG: DUF2807 domain-containing protein [Candidatus Eremiobacteraeota bacterium]|nr:DUF2807 domain-containing protein [Candidatus Eremiobacteraeota bacterium]